jgi:hypothetical protein
VPDEANFQLVEHYAAISEASIATLTEDLTRRRPDGLLTWTRRVLDENGNGPLAIVCYLESEYNLAALRGVGELVRERRRATA